MRPVTIKKLALAFAMFAFAILLFGSLLYGARMATAFIRGVEAGFVFGGLTWALGTLIMVEHEADEKNEAKKDTHLDKVV